VEGSSIEAPRVRLNRFSRSSFSPVACPLAVPFTQFICSPARSSALGSKIVSTCSGVQDLFFVWLTLHPERSLALLFPLSPLRQPEPLLCLRSRLPRAARIFSPFSSSFPPPPFFFKVAFSPQIVQSAPVRVLASSPHALGPTSYLIVFPFPPPFLFPRAALSPNLPFSSRLQWRLRSSASHTSFHPEF